jgi:hypothetical protein
VSSFLEASLLIEKAPGIAAPAGLSTVGALVYALKEEKEDGIRGVKA